MSDLLTPPLTHACIISICTDPCLYAGEHQKDRISVCESAPKPKNQLFGTWLAKGAEMITVSKYKGTTLIYLPSQDIFYFAAPNAILSPECPDKTVMLGQFVVDGDAPRVLVFDLVKANGVPFAEVSTRRQDTACGRGICSCTVSSCSRYHSRIPFVGECITNK
jgi:hypothetical protein